MEFSFKIIVFDKRKRNTESFFNLEIDNSHNNIPVSVTPYHILSSSQFLSFYLSSSLGSGLNPLNQILSHFNQRWLHHSLQLWFEIQKLSVLWFVFPFPGATKSGTRLSSYQKQKPHPWRQNLCKWTTDTFLCQRWKRPFCTLWSIFSFN